MVFRLKIEELIIKNLSSEYMFFYSTVSKNQLLIGHGLNFILDGTAYDTDSFPFEISDDAKHTLEATIRKNPDFFDVVFDSEDTCERISELAVEHGFNRFTDATCNILSAHPKPWWIMIETTTNCNLKCHHCYNCNDHKYISTERIEKLLSMLDPDDNYSVTLTGGEVLLHPQLEDILLLLKKYEKVVSFNSNGTLLSQDLLNRILAVGCCIGSFQLSLYAVVPEIHDSITGVQGSFQKTMNALELLKSKGVKCTLASLVVPSNINQVKPLINFARSKNLDINFCFKCISNCQDACVNQDCDLSPEQFSEAYSEYLSQIPRFYRQKQKFYNNHICMAGINKLTLGASGDLFLCPTWKEDHFTNIDDISSFDEFWNSEKVCNIRKIGQKDFFECSNCEIKEYCRPCLADNFNKGKDVLKLNHAHCAIEKIKAEMEAKRCACGDGV